MAPLRKTRVLPITSINPPDVDCKTNLLEWWDTKRDSLSQDQVQHLIEAAQALRTSCVPVAFPTETVYGLGADATRSEAVRGIYAAKRRPADNPLIVHVGSLDQLRALLRPPRKEGSLSPAARTHHANGIPNEDDKNDGDPIPSHYHPMIQRFWPGPLTLLFPLPSPSPLAPEVTTSLHTVGIRMPSSPLARLLISLCEQPLAAPSANASTRPSPTTAAHVLQDLDRRIDLILDGGACQVGVESTVVDGLGTPPVILRPGGVGIEEIRRLGGVWGDITVAYQDRQHLKTAAATVNGNLTTDGSQIQTMNSSGTKLVTANSDDAVPAAPRAPGMKYRHYAPRARVHLFEDTVRTMSLSESSSSEAQARAKVIEYYSSYSSSVSPLNEQQRRQQQQVKEEFAATILNIGIICTKTWHSGLGFMPSLQHQIQQQQCSGSNSPTTPLPPSSSSSSSSLQIFTFQIQPEASPSPDHDHHNQNHHAHQSDKKIESKIHSISLGADVQGIARGLFSALRALDTVGCDVILIEGVADRDRQGEGGGEGKGVLAAAVMNRLRKAADGEEGGGGGGG